MVRNCAPGIGERADLAVVPKLFERQAASDLCGDIAAYRILADDLALKRACKLFRVDEYRIGFLRKFLLKFLAVRQTVQYVHGQASFTEIDIGIPLPLMK